MVTKNISFRGPTFRMKILLGLYYRSGNINIGKKTEVELCKIDEGMIFVTNKRILFVGVSGSQKIDFKKIVDLGTEKDVLTIIRDSGSNKFLKINNDAGYAGNLIKALMKATQ